MTGLLKPRLKSLAARSHLLVLGLDLAGTVLFSVQGADMAIHGRLDLLGVAVVAFVSALGGGILRDLLIGAVPPAGIQDWRYPTVAFAAAMVTFVVNVVAPRAPGVDVMVYDAAGLAMFSVAGAAKALDSGLNPVAAVLMGGLTGVGGGVGRDLLLNRIPSILRTDFYATAALAGALVLVAGRRLGLGGRMSAALGVATCFGLRVAGAELHWSLPVVIIGRGMSSGGWR